MIGMNEFTRLTNLKTNSMVEGEEMTTKTKAREGCEDPLELGLRVMTAGFGVAFCVCTRNTE